MKILGINGTLVGSKPALLAQHALKQLSPYADVEFIDIQALSLDFCDGRPLSAYSADTQLLAQKVAEADAFVIGTTVLHGSMPAPLKNVFELVPIAAFAKKSVLFVANGGNELHYLAVENYVKPVASYLNMYVYPQYAFILSSQFTAQNELQPDTEQALNELVQDFSQYALALTKEEVV